MTVGRITFGPKAEANALRNELAKDAKKLRNYIAMWKELRDAARALIAKDADFVSECQECAIGKSEEWKKLKELASCD